MTTDTPCETPQPTTSAVESLLDRRHRLTTVGLVLTVTLVAFEALAVATVMPTVATALHGLASYGWGFTAFLISSIVGIVVSGQWADRSGPKGPLLLGLGVFACGLVVAGAATSMVVFVGGRAVQGLGSGHVIVAIYVLIARVYDEGLRPRVFSAISAAWVVPALVGPALAGLVADHFGWRWVFWGLPPFIVAGLALLVPTLRRAPQRPGDPVAGAAASTEAASSGAVVRGPSWPYAVALAVGVGLLQEAGLQVTHHVGVSALLLALPGAALVAAGLVRLLPAGTARVRRGLPAVIALRALLAGSFFGAEAFVPLTLSSVHHFAATLSGVPLTVGAVGWFGGSYVQGHRDPAKSRAPLVRAGFSFVTASVLLLTVVTVPAATPWLAVLVWCIGGFGMGLAMGTISVLVLELSPPTEQGVNSAALQIADNVGSTLCIGLAGVLFAVLRPTQGVPSGALLVVFVTMALVAAGGLGAARRVTP